jgi:hypothetical protein
MARPSGSRSETFSFYYFFHKYLYSLRLPFFQAFRREAWNFLANAD